MKKNDTKMKSQLFYQQKKKNTKKNSPTNKLKPNIVSLKLNELYFTKFFTIE